MAEIVRKNIERNPELQIIMEGIIADYWPTFQILTPSARAAFRNATRLLFDLSLGECAWEHAAMLASKSLELQLRATVFEPFADNARRTAALPIRANTPGTRPEPLVAFVQRGPGNPLTLGAMVNYLFSIINPKEGVERSLRDWLRIRRPKLSAALTYRKLNATVDIGALRNRATHASISQEEAANLYRAIRSWLDELTRDK